MGNKQITLDVKYTIAEHEQDGVKGYSFTATFPNGIGGPLTVGDFLAQSTLDECKDNELREYRVRELFGSLTAALVISQTRLSSGNNSPVSSFFKSMVIKEGTTFNSPEIDIISATFYPSKEN